MLLFTQLQRLHTTKYTNISIKHLTQLEDYRNFHENLIIIQLLNKSPDAAHPSEIFPPMYRPRQRHIPQDCHLRYSTSWDPLKYHKRYVEIKCQLDATEVFITDLIACSTCFGHHYTHHQELKSIIRWLLPVVFHAVVFKLVVWCGAEGYVRTRPATWKPQHEIPQAATTV